MCTFKGKSRPPRWGLGIVSAVTVIAEKVMKSGKLRIAIVGGVCYHSLATQFNMFSKQGMVFTIGKNAFSIFAFPVWMLKNCVAAKGALRFSCAVPFGVAHFLN